MEPDEHVLSMQCQRCKALYYVPQSKVEECDCPACGEFAPSAWPGGPEYDKAPCPHCSAPNLPQPSEN